MTVKIVPNLKEHRTAIRAVFLITVLLLVGFQVASGLSSDAAHIKETRDEQMELPFEEREKIAPKANGTTVLTGQATPSVNGGIVAFAPDGRLLYQNKEYKSYFDVDPSPEGHHTVLYSATKLLTKSECNTEKRCRLNVVERVNLTTGKKTQLHSTVYPDFSTVDNYYATKWHDVDRIDDEKIIVADITHDSVFIVNTTTGVKTWEWSAQGAFPQSGGGTYPYDWTHLNDVEVLDDGRIMVSLRNQDQVAFINRSTGLIREWTLGSDDKHEVLYEQHNPDYISSDDGGPAVLVADSQNNRIIEYQRTNGRWEQSWIWTDSQLQWPRDADRLPNGHTLIGDVHGNRVIEVNESGEIVWQVYSASNYDVERLNTGDESAGGPSAREASLKNVSIETNKQSGSVGANATGPQSGVLSKIRTGLKNLIPQKLLSAFFFITPRWFRFFQLIALVGLLCSIGTWSVLEYHWSGYHLELSRPVHLREE